MSPGVSPAKVWMFAKSGEVRVQRSGAVTGLQGSRVTQGWLNAVKARYTRLLRGASEGLLESWAALPGPVQTRVRQRFGEAEERVRAYCIEIGRRQTLGAAAWVQQASRLEVCVYDACGLPLATGHALPGDTRFTWWR